MDPLLKRTLRKIAADPHRRITVLTGAGISAESGIPTFRGPEGYWTVGSREYQPQEMGTFAMFSRLPFEVWKWYLYRLSVCRGADPNPGHRAVADLERALADRFTLITQNVDGLHLLAGNSLERTYQIHGNISFMRCAAECGAPLLPIPVPLAGWRRGRDLTAEEEALLICPACGDRTRPHVLWFDEVYDEPHFRFESSLDAAARTDLLIVVGTSGMTNLPNQVAWIVSRRPGAVMVDINPEPNPFSDLARQSGGFFIQAPGGAALPEIAALLTGSAPS